MKEKYSLHEPSENIGENSKLLLLLLLLLSSSSSSN
jgi:hypothetical protein